MTCGLRCLWLSFATGKPKILMGQNTIEKRILAPKNIIRESIRKPKAHNGKGGACQARSCSRKDNRPRPGPAQARRGQNTSQRVQVSQLSAGFAAQMPDIKQTNAHFVAAMTSQLRNSPRLVPLHQQQGRAASGSIIGSQTELKKN